jgi:hypothetical protein
MTDAPSQYNDTVFEDLDLSIIDSMDPDLTIVQELDPSVGEKRKDIEDPIPKKKSYVAPVSVPQRVLDPIIPVGVIIKKIVKPSERRPVISRSVPTPGNSTTGNLSRPSPEEIMVFHQNFASYVAMMSER